MDTDTIVFWDAGGGDIVTITGLDSDILLKVFDTPEIREKIARFSSQVVDNTSEENAEDHFLCNRYVNRRW